MQEPGGNVLKILSLRLKNINCFRENIHLDFASEPLHSASLFAITGPTGSGKTTLLDAISVALYNRTPRLDGTGTTSPGNLLSQGANEGAAEVVFKVDGTKYLAHWGVRRSKKGELKTEVKLLKPDTNELITNRRRGKAGNDLHDMGVEEAVTAILGMDFNAFRRSILLAQGDFAAFLKASADERRQILEATTGLGLFEIIKKQLKIQLDNVTNRYDLAGAGLKQIPVVSPEDVRAVEEELRAVEAELQQLNQSRTLIEEEKKNELQRVDAYYKLNDNTNRRKDLQSRKPQIDALEQEMKRAQQAADIRSEMIAYQTEKKRIEAQQTELQQGRAELEKAKQKCSEAKSKYDAVSLEFEQLRKEAEAKRNTFNDAAILESQAKKQLEEAQHRQHEADSLNIKLGQLKEQIKQKNDEIARLEKLLADDREYLKQYPLPDDADNLLAGSSQIAARLGEMHRALAQQQEILGSEENEHKERTNELELLVEAGKKLDAAKADITARLDAAGKALELLTAEGNEQYWRTIRSAWGEVRDAGNRFFEQYDRLDAIFSKTVPTPAVREFTDALDSFKHRFELLDQQRLTAEEKVKRCQAEEKAVAAANQALILRREFLAAGEPCPVCGSTEHPDAGKLEPEREGSIDRARENIHTAEAELDNVKHDLESAFRELSDLARQKVAAEDDKLSDIESQIKKTESIQHEMKLAEQQIQSQSTNLANLNRQIENVVQKMRKTSAEIQEIKQDIAKCNEQFLSIIPPTFAGEPPASAFEKFKLHISDIRMRVKRTEQNSSKAAEQNAAVVENVRQLQEDTERFNSLLENAAGYRDEGGRLLEQVKEKTGGMGVDAARSALESSLRKKEEQFNAALENFRQAETQLTDITARVKTQEENHSRTLKVLEGLQSAYMRALESAGFESAQSHQAAFREAAWLEKNKLVLSQYEKDINTVEENIKVYEAVFTGTPFNADDLPHIREREQALIAQIEMKNSKKGEINRTITYMNDNLKLRQEQEKEMESIRIEMQRWQNLSSVMPHNELRDFALQTMFNLLTRIANRQLYEITSRYALRAVDMKDMVVIDRWNAGEERPVETLSGGESFLVSLSLALALSELSRGRTRLESLFLDEGFGTLDSETLEAALHALESLRLSGRTIGVISHVDQLTRRIPVRIEVKKTGSGNSRISVRG